MNWFGLQPCSRRRLSTILTWRRRYRKTPSPVTPKNPNAGSFLSPCEHSAKKDLTHNLVEMAISFHARRKLQTQAMNPQHICPPNGRLWMNGTRSQPDLNVKQREKNGLWPSSHMCDSQIFTAAIRPATSSPTTYLADAHLNKWENTDKSHTEENRSREKQVFPSFMMGIPVTPNVDHGSRRLYGEWTLLTQSETQNVTQQIGCPQTFPGHFTGLSSRPTRQQHGANEQSPRISRCWRY